MPLSFWKQEFSAIGFADLMANIKRLSFYLVAPLFGITASLLSVMMKPTASECNKFPCSLTQSHTKQAWMTATAAPVSVYPACLCVNQSSSRINTSLSTCLAAFEQGLLIRQEVPFREIDYSKGKDFSFLSHFRS